jgi:hypothetical protein
MLTLGKRAIVIENARCVRPVGQHQSKPANMVSASLIGHISVLFSILSSF